MHIAVNTRWAQNLFNLRKELVEAWVADGHMVTAIGELPEDEFAPRCNQKGFNYRQIRIERNGVNPVTDISSYFQIKSILKEINPDIVFCIYAKAIAYGSWAARSAGVKHIFPLVSGLGTMFNTNSLKGAVVKRIMCLLYKNAFKGSEKVIFQNRDNLSTLLNLRLLDEDKSVIVNGSGVDLNRFTFTPINNNRTFLFVGRLLRDKGIREYIAAAKIIKAKFPDSRFIAVGDIDTNPTSLSESEVAQYQETGLIEFKGYQTDVRPFISEANYFVLPSYHEGTPRSVLEAMAMGRPIITTDAPGCRETVIEGRNGFLVPVRNVEALAEKMETLLYDFDLAKKMGQESRRIAESKYDVKLIIKDYARIMNLDDNNIK